MWRRNPVFQNPRVTVYSPRQHAVLMPRPRIHFNKHFVPGSAFTWKRDANNVETQTELVSSLQKTRQQLATLEASSIEEDEDELRKMALLSQKVKQETKLKEEGSRLKAAANIVRPFCQFYAKYGYCQRISSGCPFNHRATGMTKSSSRYKLRNYATGSQSALKSKQEAPVCKYFLKSGYCLKGIRGICKFNHSFRLRPNVSLFARPSSNIVLQRRSDFQAGKLQNARPAWQLQLQHNRQQFQMSAMMNSSRRQTYIASRLVAKSLRTLRKPVARVPPRPVPVCKFYLRRGFCPKMKTGCPFSHRRFGRNRVKKNAIKITKVTSEEMIETEEEAQNRAKEILHRKRAIIAQKNKLITCTPPQVPFKKRLKTPRSIVSRFKVVRIHVEQGEQKNRYVFRRSLSTSKRERTESFSTSKRSAQQNYSARRLSLLRKSLKASPQSAAKFRWRAKSDCGLFIRRGFCERKENGTCPYLHDSEKISMCSMFLAEGKCDLPSCMLVHRSTWTGRQTQPTCVLRLRGLCDGTRANGKPCVFFHPEEPVEKLKKRVLCGDFMRSGYCRLGNECQKLHVNICQKFALAGRCPIGNACRDYHFKTRLGLQKNSNMQKNGPLNAANPSLPSICLPSAKQKTC